MGKVVDQAALAELLAHAQQVAGDPTRFASYAGRPAEFAKEVLGVELWSKQVDVLKATHAHRRVVVRSGHSVGKTFSVACLVLYWLYAEQGLVVTTAPTKEHVEDVLWRTIHEILRAAPVQLPGERSKTELKLSPTWYATGITTASTEAFTGRHHPKLLVVIDEAPGVEEDIHLAVSTLTTGANNRLVLIGNPTTTSGTFYNAFRYSTSWKTLAISCLEHPNVKSGVEGIKGAVTREWIAERRELWGENHPFWYSRVLGEFPKISTRGVVPLGWVERAQDQERWKAALAQAEGERVPRVGGLDVARYGDNRTVLIVRRGDAVERIEHWTHTSLTETAGRAKLLMQEWDIKHLVIDAAGIGAGVYDIMADQKLNVYAFNSGHRAFTPGSFSNRRSELWWHVRERFERSMLWLPNDIQVGTLVADLTAPEYKVAATGRLQVETKENLLDRGVPSPDYADALIMCFALDADPDQVFLEKPKEGRDTLGDLLTTPVLPDDSSQFEQLPAGF
ncbi:MAG: hypothetical protein L0Z53_06530 [Acidobacteriales bacterium]|nr:hypothetical protein [Terriglobales bacterium]